MATWFQPIWKVLIKITFTRIGVEIKMFEITTELVEVLKQMMWEIVNELAKKWDFHEEKLDFFPTLSRKKKNDLKLRHRFWKKKNVQTFPHGARIYNQTLHTDTTGIQRLGSHPTQDAIVITKIKNYSFRCFRIGNPNLNLYECILEYILGPKSGGLGNPQHTTFRLAPNLCGGQKSQRLWSIGLLKEIALASLHPPSGRWFFFGSKVYPTSGGTTVLRGNREGEIPQATPKNGETAVFGRKKRG